MELLKFSFVALVEKPHSDKPEVKQPSQNHVEPVFCWIWVYAF